MTTSNRLLNKWNLKYRVYIVTGGTKGIGYATSRAILSHGASGLLICGRNQQECNDAESSLRHEFNISTNNHVDNPIISSIACDISTEMGRKQLVEKAQSLFEGKLHGLVNNVGMNIRKPISQQTYEEYNQIMKTNVDSMYFLCKDLQPLLSQTAIHDSTSTAVVNVASAAGVQSSGTGAVYGMSKAAMIQFSKILACEWAQFNIRVNCVAPWMTMTPLLQDAIKDDPSQLDKVKMWTPMQRLATPEEIANPITFLLMDASSYVTGQCLGIDGGLTAQGFAGPCATNDG